MAIDEAIYVDGIGYIAQYHSYVDQFWEKNIAYFVRDCFYTGSAISIDKIRKLNSNISVIEHATTNKRS